MKILFLAPYKDYEAKDGGYGTFSSSLLFVLEQMVKQKLIELVDVINILKPPKQFKFKQYDISFTIMNPNSFNQPHARDFITSILKFSKRNYLNILWETFPLPRSWNFLWKWNVFEGFVTPSYFTGKQLLDMKLQDKKIYYLPCHVPVNFNSWDILKDKKNEKKFTVLFVGQNTKRKGIDESIISFVRAFDGKDDVQMFIKSHNLSQYETPIEDKIRQLSQLNSSCRNIKIYSIEKNLTYDEVLSLYKNTSVLLFVSRGEGFGLPPAEFMSLGLPVIYSQGTSLPEVCSSPCNIPIPGNYDEAINMFEHGYEPKLQYFYPSIGKTIEALQIMYTIWKKDKNQFYEASKINQKVINDRFGCDSVIKCYQNIFNKTNIFSPNEVKDESQI